jgi:K+-sensing histidine kinase KdpD
MAERPPQPRSRRRRTASSNELLATLSHQLRGPLNVIMGWAHVLRDPRLDRETVARGAEIICENVELQSRLIADLLDTPRRGGARTGTARSKARGGARRR